MTTEVTVIKAEMMPDGLNWESSRRRLAIKELVRRTVDMVKGMDSIFERADTVVIKPNLVVPVPPSMHITTDPHVTASLVELVKEAGVRKVIVAENPALIHKGKDAFRVTMTEKFCRKAGAEIAYLDECEQVAVDIPNGKAMQKTMIPKVVLESDAFINVPKMKTHWLCQVTLGIKNLLGVLPFQEKIKYHREDIHQKLVDILSIVKPTLTVIDGLVAMEGQGPRCGQLIKMNTLIAGRDTVAVDAVTSAVMGFDPLEINEVRIANAQGLGVGEIDKIVIKGELLENVRRPFKRASRELVAVFPKVEAYLGGACKACQGFTRATLDALYGSGNLDQCEKISVVIGRDVNVPSKLEGVVFI
ncbi:DUF362 domain-containing protein, partial [Candidatus Bathyarchaeota archaeon]|nr:DUF362 domain-containing protein [Candidatus Bathyarchaeota archaeon]